jgi:hypothetical protein
MDMKLLDGFSSIGRLGDRDHVLLGAYNHGQPFPEDWMIFHDQYSNCFPWSHTEGCPFRQL